MDPGVTYIFIRTPDRHGKKISNRVCIYRFSAWKPHLASQVFDLKKAASPGLGSSSKKESHHFQQHSPTHACLFTAFSQRQVSCKHEVVVVQITLEANTVRVWSLWSGVFLFFFLFLCAFMSTV